MNKPEYLILSNTYDYSTDYICAELNDRGEEYLRINRDQFDKYSIGIDPLKVQMYFKGFGEEYQVDRTVLRGIYYRAPVFLRYSKSYNLEDQLKRGQWSSFLRNLIIFEDAKWVNHPVSTYRAENKLFQLKTASACGFKIPATYCGNSLDSFLFNQQDYVVKALDTPVFFEGSEQLFMYATVLNEKELYKSNIEKAPVIIQENVRNKTDIRVTVVGDRLFPVEILSEGQGIPGDWRTKAKEELEYKETKIPSTIEQSVIELMKSLGLYFGGVDLLLSDNNYYFLEINPTGEWGWLNKNTSYAIDKAIANCLRGKDEDYK